MLLAPSRTPLNVRRILWVTWRYTFATRFAAAALRFAIASRTFRRLISRPEAITPALYGRAFRQDLAPPIAPVRVRRIPRSRKRWRLRRRWPKRATHAHEETRRFRERLDETRGDIDRCARRAGPASSAQAAWDRRPLWPGPGAAGY